MDSPRNRDRLSSLPELVLAMIISNLPFKEAVSTSALKKRWENVHRGTTNVSFKESEFVKSSVSDGEGARRDARASFVRYMLNWVSRFTGDVIESFELCLSKPVGFETEINSLIEFAISKNVKNLVLDFSDSSCTTSNQAASASSSHAAAASTSNQAAAAAVVFHLPECVYNQATVESLKLFACGFDPIRFAKPCSFKRLCFGWVELGRIMALLSKTPLLESLSMQNCWNVGLEAITEYNIRIRELVFESCDFAIEYSLLDLPNIQIFKYTGEFHFFQFLRVNRRMEEAYLDFGAETDKDQELGTILCDLLYDLLSARKITVCPYLIKAIRESDDPVKLKDMMETRHLVMKTNLIPDEFIGIEFMINSSPELETLTFQMLPPIPVPRTNPSFHPKMYWTQAISHDCLEKTLKVVEVRNFTGKTYELNMIKYLIQRGLVLERMDLFLPLGTSGRKKTSALRLMRKLWAETEASSDRLWFRLHDG